jgi:hypothetical protein
MDPRTFLRPEPLEIAPRPRVGQRAPELDGLLGDRPVAVTFLRHVGCPFAEATFRQLRERAQVDDQVRFVAVSHAPEAQTRRWCSAVAGDPGAVELVFNADRSLYARWGLGTSSLSHFMGLRSLSAVSRLAREGIRNRHPVGTRWQSAGTFAVDAEGVVRWLHIPAHAGSLPDLKAAASAARGERVPE